MHTYMHANMHSYIRTSKNAVGTCFPLTHFHASTHAPGIDWKRCRQVKKCESHNCGSYRSIDSFQETPKNRASVQRRCPLHAASLVLAATHADLRAIVAQRCPQPEGSHHRCIYVRVCLYLNKYRHCLFQQNREKWRPKSASRCAALAESSCHSHVPFKGGGVCGNDADWRKIVLQ